MARTTIRTEDITASEVTTAKMATDPTNASNLSSGSVPTAQLGNVNTSGLEDDIALLGFKVASNGSLAKYNLVDQTVDDFQDTSGVNASGSTNEVRDATGKYYSGGASGSGSGGTATTYTYNSVDYKVNTFLADSNFVLDAGTGDIDALLVAGGGGGGGHSGGGAGAGGLLWETGITLSAGTYAVNVGDGGAGTAGGGLGIQGDDTTFVHGGTTYTAIGGGYGSDYADPPGGGGSGGGSSRQRNDQGGLAEQPTSTDGGYGNDGGGSASAAGEPGHGGGGAGQAGQSGNDQGGVGGNGHGSFINSSAETDALLTSANVGEDSVGIRYLAAGGGGAGHQGDAGGAGGTGGGGDGAGGFSGDGGNGLANTGSGGGGGSYGDPEGAGGAGGKGLIVIRYIDGAFVVYNNMTLVSTTTAAQAAPTKGDIVFTYTNGAGSTTLGTDVTAEISADGGSTWTAMTLGSEGSTGSHNIATAHDVTITSTITSPWNMAYRIKTLNQSVGKTTRIQAVSLGWS